MAKIRYMEISLLRSLLNRKPPSPTPSDLYKSRGYFVFRQAIDRALIDSLATAEETFVRHFDKPLLRHNGQFIAHDHSNGPPWDVQRRHSGLMNAHTIEDSSLRHFRDATIRLLTSDAMYNCLYSLDGEERYTLHQSIFFFVSARTDTHLDRVSLDTTPPGKSFTVWIPLDPVSPANGPLFIIPQPLGTYYTELENVDSRLSRGEVSSQYNDLVARKMASLPSEAVMPFLQPGDVVVFGPSTPHGSFAALDKHLWRRSFQAIYRPTSITAWGAFPNSQDSHSIEHEEIRFNPHFNLLRH